MLNSAAEVQILKRLFRPDLGNLSPNVARELLKLDFDEPDHERMKQLSTKAQDGTLTADEREELEGYSNISDLLVLLQSRARISLKNAGYDSSAA